VVTTHIVLVVPRTGTQQAPVAGGGVGLQPAVLQLVPSPRYVPFWVRQLAAVVCTQKVPLGVVTQHAPVTGVGVGAHVVFAQVVPLPR
jgi:hypothetical protein